MTSPQNPTSETFVTALEMYICLNFIQTTSWPSVPIPCTPAHTFWAQGMSGSIKHLNTGAVEQFAGIYQNRVRIRSQDRIIQRQYGKWGVGGVRSIEPLGFFFSTPRQLSLRLFQMTQALRKKLAGWWKDTLTTKERKKGKACLERRTGWLWEDGGGRRRYKKTSKCAI